MMKIALLLILALSAKQQVVATPIVEVRNNSLYLIAPEEGSDIIFEAGESSSSVNDILEKFVTLGSDVEAAKQEAITASQLALTNAINTVITTLASAATEAKGYTDAKSEDVRTAMTQYTNSKAEQARLNAVQHADTVSDQALADANDYTNTVADQAKRDAISTADINALGMLRKEFAKNTGTNGTLDSFVTDLLINRVTVNSTISALTSRISYLEAIQSPLPKSCKDVAANLFYATLKSTLYDIFPSGALSSRMQVFCHNQLVTSSINMAYGRPSAQSSTTNGAPSPRAVDGDTNQVFASGSCTHTDIAADTWLMLDFGGPYVVERIEIWGRGDCCPERLNGMQIFMGNVWDSTVGRNDPQCTPGFSPSFSTAMMPFTCSYRLPVRFLSFHTFANLPMTICEVRVFGKAATDDSGWTIIASQVGALMGDVRSFYGKSAPTLTASGALEYYWKNDLRALATEIYVENEVGEARVFRTADFSGPLVLDGPNFADAGDVNTVGIIAGNNFPVVPSFQIGNVCSSAACRVSPTADATWSNGVFAMFDWEPRELGSTKTAHAYFGGKVALDATLSHRGKYIMIR